MNIKRNSLYFKFNILIIGAIFLCGIFMGSIFIYNTTVNLKQDLEKTGKDTALALNAIISTDVLLDNKFAIYERLMQTLKQNEQIRYIIVESPDGKILSTTFAKGMPKGLPLYKENNLSATSEKVDKMLFESNEGQILEIIYVPGNDIIGAIRIGLTENIMMEYIKEKCIQTILTILIICMISSAIATYYVWYLLEPIQIMSKAIREIAKGNYNISLDKDRNDETGRLIKAFNNMARRLSKKEKENSYLLAELRKKEEHNSLLMAQLFRAQEDERQRLSQELHDGTSQTMVSILTYLRILHQMLTTTEQKEFLGQIRELTSQTLESIRALAVNLHPPMLKDLGLIVAIEKFLDMVQQTSSTIQIEFEHEGDFSTLSDMLALVCYRIIQEGITNIVKHAQATQATVKIIYTKTKIDLEIIDDGIGFNEETAQRAKLNHHLGLRSMQKRIELLQGEFEIISKMNEGTIIKIVIPVENIPTREDFDYE